MPDIDDTELAAALASMRLPFPDTGMTYGELARDILRAVEHRRGETAPSRFPISRADLVTRLGFALAEAKVTLTPHELAARLVADIETQTCPCRGPESECGCLQDEDAPASVAAPASALPGEDRETDLLTYACRALIALDDADAVQRIVDYLYERFLGGAR